MGTTDAPPKADRQSLLKITTLAPERPVITIDDVDHEMRLMQDFGATEHHEFTRDSRRYDELWNQEKLNKGEQQQLEQLLDRLFRRALVDPAALSKQLGESLTGAIKREIVVTFTNAPLLIAMAQENQEAENSSTTES